MIDSADTTIEQLEQFRVFVLHRLNHGTEQHSIDELYDEWRIKNPTTNETEIDAKAIAASIRDLESGITGRPMEEFLEEFKTNRGLK
jgi:hypothetical protein